MTTLLISPESFESDSLELEGDVYRHLFRARRLVAGDSLRVVDGRGRARRAEVVAVGRASAEVRLGVATASHEPSRWVEVWVAPPKVGRASWMVEKLTEVGVSAVRLWTTERGPRSYGAANLERLRRVSAAAVEQCERSRVPEISGAHSWAEGLERLRDFDAVWLLQPGGPPRAAGDDGSSLALLVGPEGGWTPAELGDLATLRARPLGFGESVLRVETAAVVGASLALFSSPAPAPE